MDPEWIFTFAHSQSHPLESVIGNTNLSPAESVIVPAPQGLGGACEEVLTTPGACSVKGALSQ